MYNIRPFEITLPEDIESRTAFDKAFRISLLPFRKCEVEYATLSVDDAISILKTLKNRVEKVDMTLSCRFLMDYEPEDDLK